jgi:hypothetical protein
MGKKLYYDGLAIKIISIKKPIMLKKYCTSLIILPALFFYCSSKPTELSKSAPAITTQPQSQLVKAGDSAVLTVVAAGTPAPAYAWQKNDTALAGETGASYTVPAAASFDSGSYSVVVSNSEGSVVSDPATLLVYTLTVQPLLDTVAVGDAILFTATVTGIPAPAYQWRKDGFDIPNETNATYTKTNAALDDAGSYRVTVTNPVGSIYSDPATLTVQ